MVHHLPPWTVMCFSVLSVIYFDGQGFAYPCVSTSAPLSLTSSSMEAPSAAHHVVRMSSRALPVIIFVSLIEFLNMFMLSVARSAFGGRRRLLHAIACLPLRLVQSSVPPTPPASPVFSPHPLVVRFQLFDGYDL